MDELVSNELDTDNISTDLQFEILLHRKTIGKSTSQRTSMKKYYRDLYKKTGIIPNGLYYMEGRKASGRKKTLSKEIEKQFIEMVKKSASDEIDAPGFVTKNLRTVVNFHRKLEDKFGSIPLDALYRLVKTCGLKKYLEKQDYSDEKQDKILGCFPKMAVFDTIQIDGCEFDYIEIKDDTGGYIKPCVIEFMDTGSRYMLALDVYLSENNENSVDIFYQFLGSNEFPIKTINLRPDCANSFKNLKRPLRELNYKYSLPGKFYFSEDFARPGKPKDKSHLESCHRRLHGFEDFIIDKLPDEKLVKRMPGKKIKTSGKIQTVTISRFDISIDELRNSGLIKRYIKEHNKRYRTFTESGRQKKWIPQEKFELYLKSVDTFKFQPTDIEDCLKYGFRKYNASVAPSGRIRYLKNDYKVVIGNFYGGTKNVKIKVSRYENKLYIFEPAENGICIGEAIQVNALIRDSERQKKFREKKLKKNEFEQLVLYLEKQGMTLKSVQIERLTEIYKRGLNAEIARKIIKQHQKIYDSYLKNQKFRNLQVGTILFNLFVTHFAEYKKGSV